MDVSSSSSSTGGDGADRWLIFVVFDILYLEGDKAKEIVTKAGGLGFEGSEDVGSICNLPLFVRRKILERVIIQQPKRFVIVPSEYVPPTSQFGDVESRKCRIEKFFNSICFEVTGLVTKGGEGIVAKKETSLYELNSRTGGWVKMKPEYGGQVPELDLIVIGAHYGGTYSLYPECAVYTTYYDILSTHSLLSHLFNTPTQPILSTHSIIIHSINPHY